jgi:hypothetical protein
MKKTKKQRVQAVCCNKELGMGRNESGIYDENWNDFIPLIPRATAFS